MCVCFLLCDRVDTGLHHRQAFTAFYIVWKLLDTCKRDTQRKEDKWYYLVSFALCLDSVTSWLNALEVKLLRSWGFILLPQIFELISIHSAVSGQIVVQITVEKVRLLYWVYCCFQVCSGLLCHRLYRNFLPFLLMSSSLRLTKLAMVVGRFDRSLSGMLSFFKAWQLKSCYGNTEGKQ